MRDPQKKPAQRKIRDETIVDVLNWVLDSTVSDEEKLKFFPVIPLQKKSILFILCGMDNNKELFDKVMALFSKNETNPQVIKKINNAIQYLLKRIHREGMPEKLISCLTVGANLDRNFRINEATVTLLEYWLTHGIKVNPNFYVDILTKILTKTSINTKISALEKWISIYLEVDQSHPQEEILRELKTENPKNSIIHLISNLTKINFTSLFDALSHYKRLYRDVLYVCFSGNPSPRHSEAFIQKHAMDIQLPSRKFKIVLLGIFDQRHFKNINEATSLFIIAIHICNSELIKIFMNTDLKYLIKWDASIKCLFQRNIGPEKEETFKIISLLSLLVYLEPAFPYLSQYVDALSQAPLTNDKYISLTHFFGAKLLGSDNNEPIEAKQFLEVLRQRPTTLETIRHRFTDLIKELHEAFFQNFFPLDLVKIVMAYLFSGNLDDSLSQLSLPQCKIDSAPTPILPYSSYSSVSFHSSVTSSSSSQPTPGSLPNPPIR